MDKFDTDYRAAVKAWLSSERDALFYEENQERWYRGRAKEATRLASRYAKRANCIRAVLAALYELDAAILAGDNRGIDVANGKLTIAHDARSRIWKGVSGATE